MHTLFLGVLFLLLQVASLKVKFYFEARSKPWRVRSGLRASFAGAFFLLFDGLKFFFGSGILVSVSRNLKQSGLNFFKISKKYFKVMVNFFRLIGYLVGFHAT